jgi:uncharacterized membrane protein
MASKLFSNPALQRAWRTFFQAFVALYVVYLVPFLTGILDWAAQEDGSFPSVDPLYKGFAAAVAAGAVALVSFFQNAVEDKSGKTLPTLSKATNTP